jgi:hypothetical protein
LIEIQEATGIKTLGTNLSDPNLGDMLTGAAPAAMFSKVKSVRDALPEHVDLIVLRSRSVPESLQGQTRPSSESIIATVSRWPEFLRWSRTILIAAGLDLNVLSFRDARVKGWQRGLKSAALVITDSRMIHKLPPGCQAHRFTILADSSLAEVQQFAQQFMK